MAVLELTLQAVSPYLYLSTIFFFFSTITSDLLLVRIALMTAYFWLVVSAFSGNVPSGSFADTPISRGEIDITAIINSIILLAHAANVTMLIADDCSRRPREPEDRSLLNFFTNRCGLTTAEFKDFRKHGRWLSVKAGQPIPGCDRHLYLVVEGVADCNVDMGSHEVRLTKRSGQFFDLKLFNAFCLPLAAFDSRSFQAVAVTDCKLFAWEVSGLKAMAKSPVLVRFWEFTGLRALASETSVRHLPEQQPLHDCRFMLEDVSWMEGALSRDFTDMGAEPRGFCARVAGVARWMVRSLSVLPPRGIRHQPRLTAPNLVSKTLAAPAPPQGMEMERFTKSSASVHACESPSTGSSGDFPADGSPGKAAISRSEAAEIVVEIPL